MTSLPLTSTFPSSPYRGIDPYRFVDSPIFFARRTDTFELQRSVMIFKGMLLFGGSGAGKSSLIQAGLLPKMLDTKFFPDRIRVQNRVDEEIIIERISLNDDGKEPYLSPSLAEYITKDQRDHIVLPLKEFEKHLRAYSETHYPLLVLDQFEEVITLFEETTREPGTLEEILKRQQSLIDFFVGILHDDTLRVKVLFSFREDYLAKLTKLFLRAPELPNQYMRLLPPEKKALLDIIGGPQKDDLLPHYNHQNAFSSALVDLIKAEFEKRIEGNEINPSDVQIVCSQLWESDDPEKLFIERGVDGLLEDYYTRELGRFTGEQHDIAIGLLSHMLTFSNTRNFVSGVELIHMFQNEEEQFFSENHVSEETLIQILKDLKDTRLVRRELRYKDYFYEIASESLVPWIIRNKVARQSKLERRRLEKITQQEHQEEREKARQQLVFTRFVLAFVAVVTVMAFLLAYVIFQRKQNEETLKNAAYKEKATKEKIVNVLNDFFKPPPVPNPLNERELSDLKNKLVTDKKGGIEQISSLLKTKQIAPDQVPPLIGSSLTGNRDEQVAKAAQQVLAEAATTRDQQRAEKEKADQAKLKAIEDMKSLVKEKVFPLDLVLALLSPAYLDKDANPNITNAIKDLVAEATTIDSHFEASIRRAVINDPNLVNLVPARVYIEIESNQQTNQAKQIKAELEKNDYIIPDFEVVGLRSPPNNELRYYRQADEQKATEIVQLLKNMKIDVKSLYLKGYENSTKLRPGHYELWLASQSRTGQDWYLVLRLGQATEERQTELLNMISTVTEREGGDVQVLSANELVIGPYSEDQVGKVREQLIAQDPKLDKSIFKLKR